jgi:hypothetical protein
VSAVLWAVIFSAIEFCQPDSFAGPNDLELLMFGSAETSFGLYYSMVTLTTLGYGDITPLNPIARMFAALESFIGQLYVAILVARLVGIQISQSREP